MMDKKEFEKAFRNAIDVITEIQSGMKVEIQGRVVKVILPTNIANEIRCNLPSTKSNFNSEIAFFCGIPCEVKDNITNIQYVVEGIVK